MVRTVEQGLGGRRRSCAGCPLRAGAPRPVEDRPANPLRPARDPAGGADASAPGHGFAGGAGNAAPAGARPAPARRCRPGADRAGRVHGLCAVRLGGHVGRRRRGPRAGGRAGLDAWQGACAGAGGACGRRRRAAAASGAPGAATAARRRAVRVRLGDAGAGGGHARRGARASAGRRAGAQPDRCRRAPGAPRTFSHTVGWSARRSTSWPIGSSRRWGWTSWWSS